MTGWNLPPGCSVRDIPGNGPEDEAAEAFYDAFYEAEQRARTTDPALGDAYVEALAEWVWKKVGAAYGEGFKQGMADEAMVRDQQEAEELAEQYWKGQAQGRNLREE